jgi:GT2 family glycosyltransferase
MTRRAPIALFLYNRPDHARGVLECLARDPLIGESPVTVFCDGSRRPEDEARVAETRAVARELAPAHAAIVERDRNLGLAGSIIAGVDALCEEYGRVIVLEDDLRPSPAALTWFNSALDRYADDEQVMHVAGYMYPTGAELPEAFFYREATCWGWATWARAWARFEPDARVLLTRVRRSGRVRDFDIGGTCDYERMLYLQWRGRIDSWAIRWYASVFLAGGLCLHPARALVANHGFDGSGVHFSTPAKSARFEVDVAGTAPIAFPDQVTENEAAAQAVMAYRQAWTAGKSKRPFWKKPFRDLHYRLRIPIF